MSARLKVEDQRKCIEMIKGLIMRTITLGEIIKMGGIFFNLIK